MIEYLQRAVDYIEEHLEEPVSLDEIANHVGFSKYYLNQMFGIYTGLSLMRYLRKKKLEYGICALQSGQRILDIAMELGYSSERAFSRAITKEYGHSPGYFRTHDVLKTRKLIIYDLKLHQDKERILAGFPPNFEKVKEQLDRKEIRDMKEYLSDVTYEVIEKMTVLSAVVVGKEPEEEVIGLMNRLRENYGISVLRSFGFDSPLEETEDVLEKRGYEYWLSISEEERKKIEEKEQFLFEGIIITIKEIPSYRYASLRIQDPFSDPFERIGTGWRFLVNWLEDRDFKEPDFTRCNSIHCLEEVKEVEGQMVMDIYIPVDVK